VPVALFSTNINGALHLKKIFVSYYRDFLPRVIDPPVGGWPFQGDELQFNVLMTPGKGLYFDPVFPFKMENSFHFEWKHLSLFS
jgi:hypothetical protein